MSYWIITAWEPPAECTPEEAFESRIRGGQLLLRAASRLFQQGGVVLDQFLYPYVDRVILEGGGCLKGMTSLGDRMLVHVPDGLDPHFLGTETGLTVHIVEKRPDFSSLFGETGCFSNSPHKRSPAAFVHWDAKALPDGWKDYELRRFSKRWQAFVEMAERQIRAEGGRMILAEGQMLLMALPNVQQEGECTVPEHLKEKISVVYHSQMDPIFPQGVPPLLWEEGVPDFRK